jgi:hypothetical protein
MPILGLSNSTLECLTLLRAIERLPGALQRVGSLALHRLVLTDALLDAIVQLIAMSPNLHSFFALREGETGGVSGGFGLSLNSFGSLLFFLLFISFRFVRWSHVVLSVW